MKPNTLGKKLSDLDRKEAIKGNSGEGESDDT